MKLSVQKVIYKFAKEKHRLLVQEMVSSPNFSGKDLNFSLLEIYRELTHSYWYGVGTPNKLFQFLINLAVK